MARRGPVPVSIRPQVGQAGWLNWLGWLACLDLIDPWDDPGLGAGTAGTQGGKTLRCHGDIATAEPPTKPVSARQPASQPCRRPSGHGQCKTLKRGASWSEPPTEPRASDLMLISVFPPRNYFSSRQTPSGSSRKAVTTPTSPSLTQPHSTLTSPCPLPTSPDCPHAHAHRHRIQKKSPIRSDRRHTPYHYLTTYTTLTLNTHTRRTTPWSRLRLSTSTTSHT